MRNPFGGGEAEKMHPVNHQSSMGHGYLTRLHPCNHRYLSVFRRVGSHGVRRLSDSADWSQYQRKTPVEHVLLRPGMYIGNTSWVRDDHWVMDETSQRMVKRKLAVCPALLKIYDEILVNAADNARRQRESERETSRIDISAEVVDDFLRISVLNDGSGIPIVRHEAEGIHVPELVFGHLLTGSNFSDDQQRLTGGSHGYGAKLTNIFSRLFSVDIVDAQRGLRYRQQWTDNMAQRSPPEISPTVTHTETESRQSFTRVSFEPDLSRFGFSEGKIATDHDSERVRDLLSLLRRRAFDIAGCLNGTVNVSFNNELLPVPSFRSYCELFSPEEAAVQAMDVGDRWQVALLPSPSKSFEAVSFVNSVWTPKGGSHVQAISAQVIKAVDALLKKESVSVTPQLVKNNLMLLVNSQIPNPSFEGQTKDALLTSPSQFGAPFDLPKKSLVEAVRQSGLLDRVLADHRALEHAKLQALSSSNKSVKKKVLLEVPKLEDAHFAGTEQAQQCTLILTEGDSAKALAVAGLTVVGREFFGVMPLRGKLLNVKAATKHQVSHNEEISHLCKAIGLDFSNKYEGENFEGQGLRYGKVMIMCDQDHDGSHIKGLLINFFHHFWPNLLACEGFLQEFVTPIVKVRQQQRVLKSFFNLFDYESWKMENDFDAASSTIRDPQRNHRVRVTAKYYKGLGTSTSEEAREYFANIDNHKKNFVLSSSMNCESSSRADDDEAIDLVFSKDRSKERKQWLLDSYSPSLQLDLSGTDRVSYKDFVDKELIHFSFSDNARSIPSVVDGLKPSQRKVLFGCLQRFQGAALHAESKVVQLAGFIAERSAYHHGEASLHSTLVNMAQDFVGSNNVPLLEGVGQFGTRAKGGQDHASPRYIFAKLSPLARVIFPKADDELLDYLEEDGQSVEPEHFAPVIPFLLVNGAHGIGTGWSTKIPAFNLFDLIDAIEYRVTSPHDARKPVLTPWYRGFTGTIEPAKDSSDFVSFGVAQRLNKTTIEISELPVEKWTEDYKVFLYRLVDNGLIKGFKEFHGTNNVRFVITATKAVIDDMESAGLLSSLKLSSSINLSNMHAFNAQDRIVKYDSPEAIIDDYFPVRWELYEHRKKIILQNSLKTSMLAENKSKFVEEMITGKMDFKSARGQEALVAMLRSRGFKSESEIDAHCGGKESVTDDFSYLLNMPLYSLSLDQVQTLLAQKEDALNKLKRVQNMTVASLWADDLAELRKIALKHA